MGTKKLENKAPTDYRVIGKLIKQLDWKQIVLSRHHKYVESLLKHNRQPAGVAKEFGFPTSDIHNIFWRVQKQLMQAADRQGISYNFHAKTTLDHYTVDARYEKMIALCKTLSKAAINKLSTKEQRLVKKLQEAPLIATLLVEEELNYAELTDTLFGQDGLWYRLGGKDEKKEQPRSVKAEPKEHRNNVSSEDRLETLLRLANEAISIGVDLEDVLTRRQYEYLQMALNGATFNEVMKAKKITAKSLRTTLWSTNHMSAQSRIRHCIDNKQTA